MFVILENFNKIWYKKWDTLYYQSKNLGPL